MHFFPVLLEQLVLMHIIDPDMSVLHFLQHLHQLFISGCVSTVVILSELFKEETNRFVFIVVTFETQFVVPF